MRLRPVGDEHDGSEGADELERRLEILAELTVARLRLAHWRRRVHELEAALAQARTLRAGGRDA